MNSIRLGHHSSFLFLSSFADLVPFHSTLLILATPPPPPLLPLPPSLLKNEAVFVSFVTAGFPHKQDTVDVLLALEAGGADIIELGVREYSSHSSPFTHYPPSSTLTHFILSIQPTAFSDSTADGLAIVEANHVSQKTQLLLNFCDSDNPILF